MKRIVITGPESTGKSTLCQQLAGHYKTVWCPEYARAYLSEHGTDYSYNDLLAIAKGQCILEDDLIHDAANDFYFIDTDMYVMKVWCEYVFGKCHQFVLDQVNERKYDLYLLCNVDLPWVKDELREYPNEEPRKELFHIYKDILINQNAPWVIINGNYNQRLQSAIDAVKKYCMA